MAKAQHHQSRSPRLGTLLHVGTLAVFGCAKPVADNGFDLDVDADSGSSAASSATVGETGDPGTDGASASVSSTAMTTSASSAETGDPECGLASTCGVAAPDGWFGPTARARLTGGAPLPDCPAEYPEPGPTVLEGYNDPGPAICECSCEVNAVQSCTTYAYSYGDAACSVYVNFLQFTEECHDFTIDGAGYFYMFQQNQPFCQAMKNEELPEVPWDADIRSCKLPDLPTSCGDDGVCTPDPPEGFEPGLCVYAQGDLECPAGPYATKYTYYSGADDQRDCSNCTCGQAVATCTGSMYVYDGAGCGGNQVADVPSSGQCTPAVGASVGLNFTGESSCPVATPPEPMGTIAPTGEFTFCCAE